MFKITPTHDPNDFEVGNRQNLERVKVLNPNGTMNENAGIYNGLDRFECRKKVVEDLEKQDILIKIEKITEINELTKEKENLIKSIERREKLLSNENYVNKAPAAVVEKDKESLKNEQERLEFINKELETLSNKK